jgi:hypothetical protein
MGDGFVVSPTDLLHASQTMDSAVDQLREASDQVKSATLPDGTLGTDQYPAAITTAFNKSISARQQDIKKCAEILDAMIEALGDTIKKYHENETETAKHFDEVRESYVKKTEEFGEDYDPMEAPELDEDGDDTADGGDAADGSSDGTGDGTGDGTDPGDGATESGGASEAGGEAGAGPSGGACGEHPTIE